MDNIINLSGMWNFKLDYEDCGIDEQWYLNNLDNEGFVIPGTTASNNVGDKVIIEKKLTKEAIKSLRQEKRFIGVLWLQREINIGEVSDLESVFLRLERIIFKSSVWIDNNYIGDRDSLSVAHKYDITKHVEANKTHTLTIRIDNRDIHNIGIYPSAYTDETQTIWNGIVGKVQIEKLPLQNIDNLIIGLNKYREVDIKFDLNFEYKKDVNAKLKIEINEEDKNIQLFENSIYISAMEKTVSVKFILNDDVKLWDEFDPQLYVIKINLQIDDEVVTLEKTTGFKFLENTNGILKINGIQRFLRGNIDCCLYPLTGYPPTEKDEWLRIFKITKDYGLNHVRFHSWCPPDEAFNAADELGVYLQVESPMWMDTWTGYAVGTFKEHYSYLPEEAANIIKEYSSHPSFCFFSNGNELNGDFNLLECMTKDLRNINPNLLYTLTSNYDREITSQDDIFIAYMAGNVGVRGQFFLDKMVDGSELNFAEAVSKKDVPVISHEVGQYVVYPNVNEIKKYKGVLKPTNFEVIKQDLEEKDLLKYHDDYMKASGKLACSLYKADLEAAIKTNKMAGIQLLGLHDFPGQSTATIGILDVFYESKGLIEPNDFKNFCDSIVPMVNLPKFKYSTKEELKATITIANYTNEILKDVNVKISIKTEAGETVLDKNIKTKELMIGVTQLIKEDINGKLFEKMKGRNKFTLEIELPDFNKINNWDLWVYEPIEDTKFDNFFNEFTTDLESKLNNGESVIFCPNPNIVKNIGPSCYFPVFWSPVHFASKEPCGFIIDTKNNLFKRYFKTEQYGSYEWKSFLENSFSVNIDELEGFEPLTMFVPNFFNNHKFTNFFEAKVGNGKLLVCLFDFNTIKDEVHEILYLKKAIKEYTNSKDFAPKQELEIGKLKELFSNENKKESEKIDIAEYKPAFADSEKSKAFAATKGNDNNPSTFWLAADGEEGHYWQVDLEKIQSITGSKVIFNDDAKYGYHIDYSVDGENWNLAVDKTDQIVVQKIHEDKYNCDARYIRITYKGLASGVLAGHQQFSVYID